ncbi:hypothetical protein [Paraburkholderia phytofirmans]|uniref:hypothetical protein n=1 Tax=Paraburkholderia phytofirmans TaxID=261302 RepID=UPI0038BCE235
MQQLPIPNSITIDESGADCRKKTWLDWVAEWLWPEDETCRMGISCVYLAMF